jgi:hypothetical protein
MLNKQPDDRFELLLKASENMLSKVHNHDDEITDLKQRVGHVETHMTCDSRKQQNIHAYAKKHISSILGSTNHPEYRKTIQWLWADFRQFFGVLTYKDTLVVDYDRAIDWIGAWRPLKTAIKEATQ